jgi:hypothetical protein
MMAATETMRPASRTFSREDIAGSSLASARAVSTRFVNQNYLAKPTHMHAMVCRSLMRVVEHSMSQASRFAFTDTDVAMLRAMFPHGQRETSARADVYSVCFEGARSPWLIVSRQTDGCYVSIDPAAGTRIARSALSDLLWR